jgi:hypothetical protein
MWGAVCAEMSGACSMRLAVGSSSNSRKPTSASPSPPLLLMAGMTACRSSSDKWSRRTVPSAASSVIRPSLPISSFDFGDGYGACCAPSSLPSFVTTPVTMSHLVALRPRVNCRQKQTLFKRVLGGAPTSPNTHMCCGASCHEMIGKWTRVRSLPRDSWYGAESPRWQDGAESPRWSGIATIESMTSDPRDHRSRGTETNRRIAPRPMERHNSDTTHLTLQVFTSPEGERVRAPERPSALTPITRYRRLGVASPTPVRQWTPWTTIEALVLITTRATRWLARTAGAQDHWDWSHLASG